MADNEWSRPESANFTAGQSSEEDDNAASISKDKEVKKWNTLDNLEAKYEHLSTTPPRTRIRNKGKTRNQSEEMSNTGSPRLLRIFRRNTTDNVIMKESNQDSYENKKAKRRSLKTQRGFDRDLKLDIDKCKSTGIDSVPKSLHVVTNKRFLSLCSQLVQQEPKQNNAVQTEIPKTIPGKKRSENNREMFHNTYSMLIRMPNSDKSCKRTVSLDQTWKNELKDLIWLEVCAKHAGRTANEQDAYLLARREAVPTLLHKILDYKFVDNEHCCCNSGIWTTQTSVLSVDSGITGSIHDGNLTADNCEDENAKVVHRQCLCIDCKPCARTIEKAMHELEELLNSLSEAESLYSSSKSMSIDHPIIDSEDFINKVKAMCLWYNMVHHQRLKIIIIKKILQKHLLKTHNKIPKMDESISKSNTKSSCSKVKFDLADAEDAPKSCKTSNCSGYSNTNDFSENNESDDDDDDVKQSSKIHIEITKTSIGINEQKTSLSPNISPETEKLYPNDNNSSDHPKSPYESTDSSAGSIISNESGFASSTYDNYDENGIQQSTIKNIDVYNLGSLTDLTKLRLYNPKVASPYRDYIEKMLKVRGLKRALYFLEKFHVEVLKKARTTLEKYNEPDLPVNNNNVDQQDVNSEKHIESHQEDDNSSDDDFQYERHLYDVDIKELRHEHSDLKRYGAWSKETLDMCLPSYRNIFLYLSTIPLENIHEFLAMRLETKPVKPSALSIKQLIQELREGLAIAVRLRGRFTRHVSTALMAESENSKHRLFYTKVISTFNNTLNDVYKLYLSYLSDWATMEHLPRNSLLAEWNFNRYLAQRLYLATTISPLTFCCLTVRQLEGAAARLKTKILALKNTAILFASGLPKPDGLDDIKLSVLKVCRDVQSLLSEERERALSSAQFARTVSRHLYHNVVYREHRRNIYKAMMCVQSVLCSIIVKLEDTTTPKRLSEVDELDKPSVQSRTKEIVSQAYKFGFEFHKEMYYLINEGFVSEDKNNLQSNIRPRYQRAESITTDSFQNSTDENCFPFTPFTPTSSNNEFLYPLTKTHQSKDEEALKYSLYGRKNVSKHSPHLDSEFNEKALSELKREDLSSVPGCESCKRTVFCENELNACERYPSAEYNSSDCNWRMVVSKILIDFGKKWMNFAMTRCERGKGRRPRWASHGLEFLILTCAPEHTDHLSDAEFEEFKTMMDACISHVIGSSAIISCGQLIHTPTARSRVFPNNPNRQFQSVSPSTPPIEHPPNLQPYSDNESQRQNKQMTALKELESKRDTNLRRAGTIGNIKQNVESRDHFRPRPVTFKWQRGIKIGQGRFGKVYTVVNIESGQLLAMKEIGLGIGDRRSFDRAANELQILEGVVHPNLVRYYGVEIYREEMLIFMELCVEGSLESMIATCNSTSDGENGSGLPEQLIRRYTGQLVSAICALHDRSIAHRDIKSGNIFLTEEGNCIKLGDFGCAVKIRANTTVPGELQGYIGTQAYMAPEVFMKSSGHGRAADIWSLGCVVVEMASGKYPWSDCDSNYQIMYKVGTGNRPEISSSLSQEGRDFCIACLQHDPTQRATAENLAQHNFLKVSC